MTKMHLKGLYWTYRARKDSTRVYYYYAWKGGPLIHKCGDQLETVPPELVEAYRRAHERKPTDGFVAGLVVRYKSSPEWKALRPRTKADYRRWLDQIVTRWADMPIEALDDRGVVKHFIAFRDAFAYSPRQADHAIMTLRALLTWARVHGEIDFNRAELVPSLYKVNKSQDIWTDAQIEAACANASEEVATAIRLAGLVGLRLGDLVKLRWDEVHLDHIARPTEKSGGRNVARIPILDETRAVLDAIPRRAVMVLTNTRGKPWSASGLSHAITDAAAKAGCKGRTTHDLRRTCATRLAAAGFTDQDIADWMGWTIASVQRLRRVYVDQEAVFQAQVVRLHRTKQE